jgi:hypothetical protein
VLVAAVARGSPRRRPVGGLFALRAYRLGQFTCRSGLIAFLLPAVLFRAERRRFTWAASPDGDSAFRPDSPGEGAVVPTWHTWARVPLADWWKAALSVAASVAAVMVQQVVVAGSIASGGRPSVRCGTGFSAELPTSRHAASERDRGVRLPAG